MTVAELAGRMGRAEILGRPETVVRSFGADSRTVGRGAMFFGLDGRRTSGAEHVEEAFRRGAVAVVAHRRHRPRLEVWKDRLAVVLVDDPVAAMGAAAAAVRERFRGPVVGLTGSNGKTTTRRLVAGLLATRYRVHETQGNHNNAVGLPLTVFGLRSSHEALVAECGISRRGEMAALEAILRPDIAVLTNIGPAHLEGLGSERGVMEEKARLLERAESSFTGAEARWMPALRRRVRGRLLRVHPTDPSADIRLDAVEPLGLEGWAFRWRGVRMRTRLYGPGNLVNAALALAVAEELGVEPKDAAAALPEIRTVLGRADILRGSGVTLLDESYNANPASMLGSAAFLDGLAMPGTKAVVLGGMAELGRRSAWWHAEVGRRLAGMRNLGRIVLVGEAMRPAAKALRRDGRAVLSGSVEEAADEVTALWRRDRRLLLLVKGSRSAGLERVVEELKARMRLR